MMRTKIIDEAHQIYLKIEYLSAGGKLIFTALQWLPSLFLVWQHGPNPPDIYGYILTAYLKSKLTSEMKDFH